MKEKLQEKTNEWMQLERKTLEQRKIADDYYEHNLMQLIEEIFLERNRQKLYEQVNYLVVSVGTSYEPIILSLRLFDPRHVLFLYTPKTEQILNKVVKHCGLEAAVYEKREVCETNPLDIYREIKRCYLKWKKPEKMYIDFTGGTKAMSAAAAMAGAVVNVQLVYVGTDDYLADFRKPNPGSETLYFIDNPLAVFGDLKIEKALTLFREYNYAGAIEKLELLKENLPDPSIRQQVNFVYLLAKTYEAWDALDFAPAYENLCKLNKYLKRDRMMYQDFILMDFENELKQQETILSHLVPITQAIRERRSMDILLQKDTIIALMFTMGQNALIRERQEKYDMSTLLLYRLLEMIEQRRLSQYNLFISNMDYSNIHYDFEMAPQYARLTPEERVRLLGKNTCEIRQKLFKQTGSESLPRKVSLLEGYIILCALNDPIVAGGRDNGIGNLQKMRSMVSLRNNSIFAHGLGPVGKDDFMKFKKFVMEIFEKFCKLEEIDDAAYWKAITWIDPSDSKSHVLTMEEN